MYKNKINAFTFVELIVVITILAVLASIGFGVYQGYLESGRDSNTIIQLRDIHDGLELYSISSRLPIPDNLVDIQLAGNTFAYQGYAGDRIIQTIAYDGGGKDLRTGDSLSYMLSENQKDFQLMAFISDPSLLSSIGVQTHALNTDYQGLFPKVIGKPLGIMVEQETNIPLQASEFIDNLRTYDINSGTGTYKSYLSDKDILYTQTDDMTQLLPNKNCNRIKELGKDTGSKVYTINPSGTSNLRVYCDMDVEGGGWTFAGFIHQDSSGEDIFFDRAFGGYDINRSGSGSSYLLNISDLSHTEVLFLYNTSNILQAEATDNLLHLKYAVGLPGMYSGNIMTGAGNSFFGGYNGVEYKSSLSGEQWNFTNKSLDVGWGLTSNDRSQDIIQILGGSSTSGVYKFTGVWGNNPDSMIGNNALWVYVR